MRIIKAVAPHQADMIKPREESEEKMRDAFVGSGRAQQGDVIEKPQIGRVHCQTVSRPAIGAGIT